MTTDCKKELLNCINKYREELAENKAAIRQTLTSDKINISDYFYQGDKICNEEIFNAGSECYGTNNAGSECYGTKYGGKQKYTYADVICIHEMSILFELSRFGRNDEYKGSKMLRYKGGLSPLIDEAVRKRKKQVGSSWRDLH